MFAAFVLLFVVVVYRVLTGFLGGVDHPWLLNIAPVAAVALCGAAYLPRRVAIALPLAMLAISDIILNAFLYHWPIFSPYILSPFIAYGTISALGFALRDRARLPELLGATLLGSLLFYVITNTGSWMADGFYTKDFAGWLQAVTTGHPGLPPTWWFHRQTLIGDLLFTLLFVGCMKLQAHKTPASEPVRREELVPW
jgi:hypothetical protein